MTDQDTGGRTGGKGRPTPKRSEAQRRRPAATTKAPTSRREAARLQRQRAQAERAKARAALRTGDDAHLPAFFRGPEKQAVRDAVDARPSVGWLIYPAFLVNVLGLVVQQEVIGAFLSVASLALMAIVVVDALRARTAVRAVLDHRFPKGTTEKGLIRYGLARNIQRRGRRMPPPRVEVGAEVVPPSTT